MKMEKCKNLNSMEVAECADIYLEFSGLLNWEKYSRLITEEVKEWVDNDVKRRATEWVNNHFKEEPFDGMLYIGTSYICLDCRYNKKERIRANYEISYVKNALTSFEQEEFQIFPIMENKQPEGSL